MSNNDLIVMCGGLESACHVVWIGADYLYQVWETEAFGCVGYYIFLINYQSIKSLQKYRQFLRQNNQIICFNIFAM